DLGRFILQPGRRLHGFRLRVRPSQKLVEAIISMLSELKVEVSHLSYSVLTEEEEATILLFLDFTESRVGVEEVAGKLGRLGLVEEVSPIPSTVEGFIADVVSCPIKIGGDRAVIFRDVGMRGFIVDLKRRIGSGGEAILYFLGFEAGREFGKRHLNMGRRVGLTDPVNVYRHISASMFNCVGYGIMETVELSVKPPYGRIRVYHSFECELGLKEGKPFSHLVRGMIAGVLTELFRRRMTAREIRCIARGDPYCEFEVSPG
ncbi:MAG: V4R domain-containing protein, partial [Candidatus Hecatellaceae archaeon]